MSKTKNAAPLWNEKAVFEEWEVRRIETYGENFTVRFEKIKRIRERVKITEDQAAVLNSGVMTQNSNRYMSAYLPAGIGNEFKLGDVLSEETMKYILPAAQLKPYL